MSRRNTHNDSIIPPVKLPGEDVHQTHRRGNEDALELGIIDLPETPNMMDPTGKATITGA